MRSGARRRLSSALVLVVLMGVLAPAVGASAAGASAAGASADAPVQVPLHVQTPVFDLNEQGAQVPGYAWNDAPGAPRLPVYGTVIELPAEGDWRISYDSPGSWILDHLATVPAVPAVLTPEPAPQGRAARVDLPDQLVTIDRPDPAIYEVNGFYPATPVVPGGVQWQRGRRLLAVRVFPFQYNPVTHELRYHPDLKITVSSESAVPAAASAGSHPTAAERAVVFPSAATGGGSLRIRTNERGMYHLTYDDLIAAGAPVADINPASLQMLNRGEVVQIQVVDNGDADFDPGDEVIFYAEPFEDRYTAQNVYWLTYSATAASFATRMVSRTTAETSDVPVTTIWQTVRAEAARDKASYYNEYPLSSEFDHWFDAALDTSVADPASTSYPVTLDDALTTGSVLFNGLFYGGKDQMAVSPDQSIVLRLNGHHVDTFQWEGQTGYGASAAADAAYLDPAAGAINQIGLEASVSQLAQGAGDYWIYPDWVELRYPARADVEDDRIFIEGLYDAGAAGVGETVHVAVSGFSEPAASVRVYDVRHPRQPVQLETVKSVDAAAPYAVDFWDEWAVGDPAPSYYLTTGSQLQTPASVELDEGSNWRDPQVADYIAIVPDELWAAIDPLLAWRASQGLAVAKVNIQDVYDEFSGGFLYPPAIRDFLKNAYETWNPAASPEMREPPQFVVLVGDGHYDFKGYTAEGRAMPNLIPPYLIDIDPYIRETAADNRFVTFDGPDDMLPDMAIGRIPARNTADLNAVIDKITAYEDPANPGYALDGAWQNRVSYVAGNNGDAAGAFHDLSDAARLDWLPDSFEDQTLYWLKDYTDGYVMRADTKAALGDSIMLQWFGHASRFAWWVDSFDFFGINSLPNMPDSTRWAFSVDYSCWTGYFINMYNSSPSLGEQLVIYPKRGAIAALSPSGKHVGAALLTLEQAVTTAVFRDRIREVGDAVNAAKQFYFANSSGSLDVIDTEILLGDPALRLRMPVTLPSAPAVSIEARGANAGLNWPHVLDGAAYEVWRDTAPYFVPHPDAGVGVLVDTIPAGFVSRGASFAFEDNGEPPTPPVKIIGDPAANYFWVLRSRNGDGVSALSNRVGEFDFSLSPGEE